MQGWNVYVHTGVSTQQYNKDSFMPERWLAGAAFSAASPSGQDREAGRSCPAASTFMLPFGLGPRMCLGRHLMKAALKLLVVMLVKDYSWDLANPDEQWSVFPTVRPRAGLLVRSFSQRQSM